MKILKPSDFSYFENKTDRVVASTIANDIVEKLLKRVINDPTQGARGEYPEGYRAAIQDILRELEDLTK